MDWKSANAASQHPTPWTVTVKEFKELCKPEFKYKLSVQVLSPFQCETITIFLSPNLLFNDEDYSNMSSFELDVNCSIALDELQLVKLPDGSGALVFKSVQAEMMESALSAEDQCLSEEIQRQDNVLARHVPGKTREERARKLRELSTPEVMSDVTSMIRGIGDICAQ